MDRTYLRPPDPNHLSQGDVVVDVPLIVAPARLILIDEVTSADGRINGRRLDTFSASAYALVQVESVAAVILTYSCDVDRGLENIIANTGPDPVELVTVTAVREVDDELRPKLGNIYRGAMPRFAAIPATTSHPDLLIDFASIQQISLRVLAPLARKSRLYATAPYGQIRLIERMAHALGDHVRHSAPAGPDDPGLFEKACKALGVA